MAHVNAHRPPRTGMSPAVAYGLGVLGLLAVAAMFYGVYRSQFAAPPGYLFGTPTQPVEAGYCLIVAQDVIPSGAPIGSYVDEAAQFDFVLEAKPVAVRLVFGVPPADPADDGEPEPNLRIGSGLIPVLAAKVALEIGPEPVPARQFDSVSGCEDFGAGLIWPGSPQTRIRPLGGLYESDGDRDGVSGRLFNE